MKPSADAFQRVATQIPLLMLSRVSPGRLSFINVVYCRFGASSVKCPPSTSSVGLISGRPHAAPLPLRAFSTSAAQCESTPDRDITNTSQHKQATTGKENALSSNSSASHFEPNEQVIARTNADDQPLRSLLPVHPSHSSLSTYISHAERSALNPTRHTYLGTRYEYLAQASLSRIGFDLLRTGKTGDRGVDLAGWWYLLPPSPDASTSAERLRVVVQCKRITGKRKLTPSVVREMDGAFLGAPAGWKGDAVSGIIVSTKPATKGVISALQSSKRALVWICLEEHDLQTNESAEVPSPSDTHVSGTTDSAQDSRSEDDTDDSEERHTYDSVSGRVTQLLYNNAARQMHLEGLDVVKKHHLAGETTSLSSDGIALVYRGQPVREHSVLHH